jgi:hypothetical protein
MSSRRTPPPRASGKPVTIKPIATKSQGGKPQIAKHIDHPAVPVSSGPSVRRLDNEPGIIIRNFIANLERMNGAGGRDGL